MTTNGVHAADTIAATATTISDLERIPTAHSPFHPQTPSTHHSSSSDAEAVAKSRPRRTLGILSDKITDEVPGSVVLLSKHSAYNAPLGLDHSITRRSSGSTLPPVYPQSYRASRQNSAVRPDSSPQQKRTRDGKIILDPQPEESPNDPLNWSVIRRDAALISLSFYCMVGGGMTTVLAPGFTNVAETYHVTVPRVALTTGLYMMGLGLGSVIASPTAILFGKRPVYLAACILFLLTAVWCALSPNYVSLVIARITMGFAVSPVECLPSATVAEIFFLHERAYRLGIYTLLLLGGKNLIPLVSAVIIQNHGWRWTFWVVAIVVGTCFFLLFLFVPETFWDRTPERHKPNHTDGSGVLATLRRITSPLTPGGGRRKDRIAMINSHPDVIEPNMARAASPLGARAITGSIAQRRSEKHAHFLTSSSDDGTHDSEQERKPEVEPETRQESDPLPERLDEKEAHLNSFESGQLANSRETQTQVDTRHTSTRPNLIATQSRSQDYFTLGRNQSSIVDENETRYERDNASHEGFPSIAEMIDKEARPVAYVRNLRAQPGKTFVQALKPWSGRLNHGNWFKFAFRPFVLYTYPAILWSATVYSLSVGWLIVLSEAVTTVYRNKDTYNFSALGTGLVYLSPFVGGILGTAVAGKISDKIVRLMARHNNGIYEPEFRLVMGIPVALATTIGLMGFGWSAAERDLWIVPTIFFGIISFGCTLGSTTAITFAVDSYRQYAGEALVTLNFSKNIFHGLVFSLFFNSWLDADGTKTVFLALGGIQLFFLLFTIPMYIYGKRARMWTVRQNFVEKFA